MKYGSGRCGKSFCNSVYLRHPLMKYIANCKCGKKFGKIILKKLRKKLLCRKENNRDSDSLINSSEFKKTWKCRLKKHF